MKRWIAVYDTNGDYWTEVEVMMSGDNPPEKVSVLGWDARYNTAEGYYEVVNHV